MLASDPGLLERRIVRLHAGLDAFVAPGVAADDVLALVVRVEHLHAKGRAVRDHVGDRLADEGRLDAKADHLGAREHEDSVRGRVLLVLAAGRVAEVAKLERDGRLDALDLGETVDPLDELVDGERRLGRQDDRHLHAAHAAGREHENGQHPEEGCPTVHDPCKSRPCHKVMHGSRGIPGLSTWRPGVRSQESGVREGKAVVPDS
jgi:hypothetical protein